MSLIKFILREITDRIEAVDIAASITFAWLGVLALLLFGIDWKKVMNPKNCYTYEYKIITRKKDYTKNVDEVDTITKTYEEMWEEAFGAACAEDFKHNEI